jgi:hypothetical protein
MGNGVLGTCLCRVLHLHFAVDSQAQIDCADYRQGQKRRDQCKLDCRDAGAAVVFGAEQTANVPPDADRNFLQLVHRRRLYSTNCAKAEPIGFVPAPSQFTAKFELPTNVMVLATSCVQPLLEAAPPANVTAPAGT